MSVSIKKLIIVGDSTHASIARDYFADGIDYDPIAFAVPKKLRKRTELEGLPVIDFEDIETFAAPSHFVVAHVAIASNEIRTKMYYETKAKGYTLVNYVSPHAFVGRNVNMGDNVFVYENNVIQKNCNIGNNVLMWSGNHCGHDSSVGNNTFLASHVVISGFCHIGSDCFLGVNSTIINNLNIGDNTII
jgi:sugar O-acyltransferase (sialic acid O-acetyltransferase NeuD family)